MGIAWLFGSELSKIILNPDSYFWFLWVLFWICIIFTLCQWIADKLKIDEFVPIVISCMVLMAVMVGLEFRVFGFQFLAYYFLFYTLGYSVHRFSILQIKDNIVLLVLGLVWLFMAWFWNMHELPSWMPAIPHVPSTLLQYAYRGITAAIAMLVLFGVAPKLLDGNSKLNTWIKELGVVSLGLYVVHLSIMGYVADILKELYPTCSIWGQISIVFVITTIFSVVIVELLKKNKWTARYLLGKI
jgi:Acyltransferase family.